MTESDWLASVDPAAMLAHLSDRVSQRKLRCWVEACREAKKPNCKEGWGCNLDTELEVAVLVWTQRLSLLDPGVRAALLREIVGNPFRWPTPRCTWCAGDGLASHEDDERKCRLCKGSGWMPAPKDWLTPLVLAAAKAIHDEQRFEDMPILADALEDAGCNNVEILDHCRGLRTCRRCQGRGKENCMVDAGYNNPLMQRSGWQWCYLCNDHGKGSTPGKEPLPVSHVRGCWVLDLLLGKE